MTLIFRHVEKKDNAILSEMIKNVFREFKVEKAGTVFTDPTTDNLFELFRVPKSILWVAEYNNEICGCCGIFPSEGLPDDYTELVKFYVTNKARGKKIGLELMKKSINSAKELGYKYMYLESLPEFDTALSMYQKEDFTILDHRLGNSKHFGCDVLMVKKLDY